MPGAGGSRASAVKRSSFFDHVALSRGRVLNHPGHADQKSHGRKGSVDDLPRMAPPSVQAAAEGTNPDFGTTASEGQPKYRDAARAGQHWNPGMGPPPSGAFEENCTNATQAFEMRMRGYDVVAAPMHRLDKYGYAAGRTGREIDEQLASSWQLPGGKPHGRSLASQKFKTFKEIDREVRDWPEGGRGFVYVGKHVFSVVRSGGKTQFVESQFGPSHVVTAEYRRKFLGEKGPQGKVIRLDDLEPADGILEAVVAA